MITLEWVQNEVQKLKAQGLSPKHMFIARKDSLNVPKYATQLYGINISVVDNLEESKIIAFPLVDRVQLVSKEAFQDPEDTNLIY